MVLLKFILCAGGNNNRNRAIYFFFSPWIFQSNCVQIQLCCHQIDILRAIFKSGISMFVLQLNYSMVFCIVNGLKKSLKI